MTSDHGIGQLTMDEIHALAIGLACEVDSQAWPLNAAEALWIVWNSSESTPAQRSMATALGEAMS